MSVDAGLLHEVVESVPAEIAILDDSGEILYTNAPWAEFGRENGLTGDPATLGVNYLEVAESSDDEYAQEAATGIRSVLSGDEELFSFEYPCHSPDKRRWFLMYARRIEYEGDRYVHLGHIDITDRKEAELDVRRKNQRLETMGRILRHDIRNPLSVAVGYLDLLAESVSGGEEYMERIRRALDRIESILSDASVLAQQTGLEDLQTVDLREVAQTAWANVATENATLSVTDSFEFAADESVLGNLFENLFRNSVSHAGPDVSVTVGRLEDGNGFFVEDDGPGIPEEHRTEAFTTEFTTSDEDVHSGLGLLIVGEITDAHDWDVTLTESAAGGARFEFRGVTTEDDSTS